MLIRQTKTWEVKVETAQPAAQPEESKKLTESTAKLGAEYGIAM